MRAYRRDMRAGSTPKVAPAHRSVILKLPVWQPAKPAAAPECSVPEPAVQPSRANSRANTRANDEDGFVLLSVVMLSVVLMMLMLGSIMASRANIDGAAQSADSVEATAAAQAGLASAYHGIETSPDPAGLPCTMASTLSPQAYGADGSFTVSIEYYSSITVPPEPANSLSCADVHDGAGAAAEAAITSTGTAHLGTGTASQTVISVVAISGQLAGYSIYSGSGLDLTNSVSIVDAGNQVADVYVDGQTICSNNTQVMGNVISMQGLQMSNSCNLSGDAWVSGNVQAANQSRVQGNAVVSGGGISLWNSATIGGDAEASQQIATYGQNAGVTGTSNADVTDVPSPPQIPFPTLEMNASAWAAAGYTVEPPNADCSTSPGDTQSVYAELAGLSTTPSKEVIQTSCQINLYGNEKISMDHSVAIFSTGGFNLANNSQFTSTDPSVAHHLVLAVPYGGPGSPSSCGEDVDLANATAIASPLVAFIYTPCALNTVNNTSFTGQVVAGRIQMANAFTLSFSSIGVVPGLSMANAVSPAGEFNLSVLEHYDRTGA